MNEAGCAAAFSQHPDAAVAVGEVVGDVLERLDPHPDLAVLLVAGAPATRLREIVKAVEALLAPTVLIGAAGGSVFGGPQELSGPGGVALWAASGTGARPFQLGGGSPIDDDLPPPSPDPSVALLLATGSFMGAAEQKELAAAVAARTDILALVGGQVVPPSTIADGLAVFGADGTGIGPGAGFSADGAVGVLLPASAAQILHFEVTTWEEGDPVPPPPVHPAPAVGALLFAGRQARLATEHSLDLEVLFDRFAGGTAGVVGRAMLLPEGRAEGAEADQIGGGSLICGDHRVAALVLG